MIKIPNLKKLLRFHFPRVTGNPWVFVRVHPLPLKSQPGRHLVRPRSSYAQVSPIPTVTGEQIDMRLVGLHNCGLSRPQHSSNGLSLSAFVILNEYPMTRCYVATVTMVVATVVRLDSHTNGRSIRDGGSVTFHPWSGTGEITVRLIPDGWMDRLELSMMKIATSFSSSFASHFFWLHGLARLGQRVNLIWTRKYFWSR